MNLQTISFSDMVTQVEKRIINFDDQLLEHKSNIRIKLEVLKGFDKSIKENRATIEQNSYLIEQTQQIVKAYQQDDLFINCKDNYSKLYQEMASQKHMIYQEFMPEIKRVIIDKTLFVKHAQLQQVEQRLEEHHEDFQELEKEVHQAKKEAEEIEERISSIETSSPAARRMNRQNTR